MKTADYSRIMNLPEEEREVALEEEKKKIYAAGGKARTALLYLEDYFNSELSQNHMEFAKLPRDADLRDFQAVHSGLLALVKLRADLESKITAADKLAVEQIEPTETEANI